MFPPIPSEIVLPFAGFVAADGDATLIGMIVAATIGSLVGAWILYGIAWWIGPDRLARFLVRYGKFAAHHQRRRRPGVDAGSIAGRSSPCSSGAASR